MKYDILILGPVSLDHNIDCDGAERFELGGAIVASGFAAANSGAKTALFTKYRPGEADVQALFRELNADLFTAPSAHTTSIRNEYLTPDKERRCCTALGQCDPFREEELPDVEASICHFAGLLYGDFSGELFRRLSSRSKIAVDVQCLLRRAEPDGSMQFRDWEEKKTYLPYIDFLKTDAAEAEILTGQTDRRTAARMLSEWGAKEVMITHNTEVLIYDGQKEYTSPIRARNLSGRTGRGDTCFAAYLAERLHAGIPEALEYAAALVSLKMETPGPFRGTRQDVQEYRRLFYREEENA